MRLRHLIKEAQENQEDIMNMRNALSDVAMQELQKIEDDPVHYFSRFGADIPTEQAMDISQTLAAVDDKTFDLLANSPYIINSLEANYNDETGESFIDAKAFMSVFDRVKARMR